MNHEERVRSLIADWEDLLAEYEEGLKLTKRTLMLGRVLYLLAGLFIAHGFFVLATQRPGWPEVLLPWVGVAAWVVVSVVWSRTLATAKQHKDDYIEGIRDGEFWLTELKHILTSVTRVN